MTMAIAGASGFVGRAISVRLLESNHDVLALHRSAKTAVASERSVVVDLSGYNAPISIAAPDAATVLPLPAGLLKGALGASGLKGVLGTTTSFLGFDPAKRTAAHRAKA